MSLTHVVSRHDNFNHQLLPSALDRVFLRSFLLLEILEPLLGHAPVPRLHLEVVGFEVNVAWIDFDDVIRDFDFTCWLRPNSADVFIAIESTNR